MSKRFVSINGAVCWFCRSNRLMGGRRYTEQDAQRIQFIKQSQKLGFSLDEISELLSLEDGQHCHEVREIALRKLDLIRERIEGLRTIEADLSHLVERCASNPTSVLCPIILTLLGKAE